MKSSHVLLGLLAGLAVGSTLGILFAPESGAKTRRKIAREAEDITDDVVEKYDEFMDTVTHKFESLKKEMNRMAEKGRTQIAQMEADAKATVKGLEKGKM